MKSRARSSEIPVLKMFNPGKQHKQQNNCFLSDPGGEDVTATHTLQLKHFHVPVFHVTQPEMVLPGTSIPYWTARHKHE